MAAIQLATLWALCLFPGRLALPLPQTHDAGGRSEQQKELAQDYIARFYPSNSKSKDVNSLEMRLKIMQKFFRLPITGILNPHIIEIMQKPRCGVPDVAEYSLFPDRPKWRSKVVTYRIISYTVELSHAMVDQLVAKALDMWSKEIPLSFQRVRRGNADIMIGFARGDHRDNYPFDGPGNTLAHAFAPGPGLGGDAHFDKDEFWTDSTANIGINFLVTATHEFGHSLGLGHSSDPNAVMYPIYSNGDPKDFKLSQDDIDGIQKLYGNHQGFPLSLQSLDQSQPEEVVLVRKSDTRADLRVGCSSGNQDLTIVILSPTFPQCPPGGMCDFTPGSHMRMSRECGGSGRGPFRTSTSVQVHQEPLSPDSHMGTQWSGEVRRTTISQPRRGSPRPRAVCCVSRRQ
ncbi:matrilysin [Sorex fumeus]|uniref:matrilysin n=1 Tax=Sorex fumeus TaxID=62283 RepID=UPI0024ADCC5A|nr:matrilysin [Sorex fumeus]